ncbi:hypothetical protein AYJ54_00505 [Bradyrhizobium centrolobii]|uniref:Uncharacterized protein n=1 Tax=Bradyrhizobium centrolobii TaxID=1505087 RepID=A0A176YGU9_9BRAD|nr:hypothetical protein AYJ54_00505 [Bradyrhizobium centrolobii]
MNKLPPDAQERIFCAALQGICANQYFFSSSMQASPAAAVEFAQSVVARFQESGASFSPPPHVRQPDQV